MIEGEPKIPSRSNKRSERIVKRWIKTVTVLPPEDDSKPIKLIAALAMEVFPGDDKLSNEMIEKARSLLASSNAKALAHKLEGVYQKSLNQGEVDFLAELDEWTEELNGLRCQIAEGNNEEREVLGSGAAITLWESLQQGNELKVINNHIYVLEPK